MRTFLRKWLGVEVVYTHVAVTKTEIQEMIGDALKQLIEENKDDLCPYYRTYRSTIQSSFNSIIENAVERKATTAAKQTTSFELNLLTSELQSEKFLDGVVERIRRKQLT